MSLLTLLLPLILGPIGDAEKRSGPGEFGEDCLSPARFIAGRVPQPPRFASIAGQSRSDRHLWARFFLVTSFGEAKEVTRSRRE